MPFLRLLDAQHSAWLIRSAPIWPISRELVPWPSRLPDCLFFKMVHITGIGLNINDYYSDGQLDLYCRFRWDQSLSNWYDLPAVLLLCSLVANLRDRLRYLFFWELSEWSFRWWWSSFLLDGHRLFRSDQLLLFERGSRRGPYFLPMPWFTTL